MVAAAEEVFLSIHFPLTREDHRIIKRNTGGSLSIHFPLTREDIFRNRKYKHLKTFNPLPSHEGRRIATNFPNLFPDLSIHFPLTREDAELQDKAEYVEAFNPLPSHEGRLRHDISVICSCVFQSTSLSRGKTRHGNRGDERTDLSIHFPLTREDDECTVAAQNRNLSIHFPLTREDTEN